MYTISIVSQTSISPKFIYTNINILLVTVPPFSSPYDLAQFLSLHFPILNLLCINIYLNFFILLSYYSCLFLRMLFLYFCAAIYYTKIVLATSVSRYVLIIHELHFLLRNIRHLSIRLFFYTFVITILGSSYKERNTAQSAPELQMNSNRVRDKL